MESRAEASIAVSDVQRRADHSDASGAAQPDFIPGH
jgi:hypothetical protein